ncbi:permease [Frigoriglobus tundricola]|uniref:Putative membrane protein, YraQ family n=1 Tax=Frigoriglobus tundricola TaxID=2774151 RepID=A0A6M5YSS2_9BACT|nr:permease [Frigoriglobus tundricola]QJW97048.1 putative membrane protein, YraQ family [Frigoriglobus tundricola]
MIEGAFWGVLLRAGEIAVEASTTLFCGLVVAGIMRRMLGADGTRRLFGGAGGKGLFRAWAVGMLLPVCSLGVIPIAREMRRAGVPSGTVLAFVLAAPHINPLSLLYGLTLSEPVVIVCFAAGSLAIALLAGAVWDRFLARRSDDVPAGDEPVPAPGLKRLAAVAVTAARESVNPTMGYVLLGFLVTGLIAGLLPHGCLGTTMRHDDPTAPLLMTAVALPLYVGPLQGMMRLGLMFEHGNSVGAAFALFELGIGMNLGMIVWLGVLFGWRRVLLWFLFVTAVTVGLGYAAEPTLYFAKEEASHTHAFDEWASPFVDGYGAGWGAVRESLVRKAGVLEIVALGGIGLLVLLGAGLAAFDRRGRVETWLTTAPPATARPKARWNRDVPGPVLGLAALAGLVAFSVAALYIYYPAPRDAFTEIAAVHAEAFVAVNTGKSEEAVRQIRRFDLLTRKLQVGVFIRTGTMDATAGAATEDLRERLEELRDALLAGDKPTAKAVLPKLDAAYRKCRGTYLPPAAGGT